MFRISVVFIPKTEANVASGRKKAVTVVNMRAAFFCLSFETSIMLEF